MVGKTKNGLACSDALITNVDKRVCVYRKHWSEPCKNDEMLDTNVGDSSSRLSLENIDNMLLSGSDAYIRIMTPSDGNVYLKKTPNSRYKTFAKSIFKFQESTSGKLNEGFEMYGSHGDAKGGGHGAEKSGRRLLRGSA